MVRTGGRASHAKRLRTGGNVRSRRPARPRLLGARSASMPTMAPCLETPLPNKQFGRSRKCFENTVIATAPARNAASRIGPWRSPASSSPPTGSRHPIDSTRSSSRFDTRYVRHAPTRIEPLSWPESGAERRRWIRSRRETPDADRPCRSRSRPSVLIRPRKDGRSVHNTASSLALVSPSRAALAHSYLEPGPPAGEASSRALPERTRG